jgi:hypothetical protein
MLCRRQHGTTCAASKLARSLTRSSEPFEAMVHFPERRADGSWAAEPIFTKRIPHTVDFQIDGAEFDRSASTSTTACSSQRSGTTRSTRA